MTVTRKDYFISGDTLSVLEAGLKGNPKALFLHGIPASAELWRDVIDKISQNGWHCFAPDLPGYGQTRISDKHDYSIKGAAKLIIKWLQQEGFSDVWLVGHDIGGGVAQLMITEKEELFQELTLSNSITSDTWPVPSVQRMIKLSQKGMYFWLAVLKFFSFPKLYNSILRSFYRIKGFSENDFARIFYDGKFHKRREVINFQRMLKTLDNRFTRENMGKLSGVSTPVHLVWAMNDRFQPWAKAGRILEDTFRDVKVTKINKAGHYLQIDAFEDYVNAILD